MPVYNVVPYLVTTIEAVLNQSFRDFELVLINDGSTDGSGDICCRYATIDSRIKVISQANQGVSAARNRGLSEASGDIIGFVDSDDIIDPIMYERMISIMHQSGADIVQCRHDRRTSWNSSVQNDRVNDYVCISGPEFVRRMFTKRGADYTNQVSLWTKIFKRKLLEKIHFPDGQTYEDEQETYKACFFAEWIALTDDILYHYIKRENSIITGIAPQKMLDKQMSLFDRLQWLPARMPEMARPCFFTFLEYSKHIMCDLWTNKACKEYEAAFRLTLKAIRSQRKMLNKYDRVYFTLLERKVFRDWVLTANFTPIQNLIARFK